MKELHADLFRHTLELRKQVTSSSQPALADTAFLLRETAKLADDARKELDGIRALIEKVACVLWVEEHVNDSTKADSIRGQITTATPDVRQMASLPRRNRNPEEYFALMDALGVPEHLVEGDLVRPHWPGMTEYLTTLAAEGKPLPAGIDPSRTYDLYRLSPMRRRKGVDLDLIQPSETV